MSEKYLTLKQNTCSSRIFLNLFGLVLEEVDEIDEFTEIKIFNNGEVSGKMYFENGKAFIMTNSNFGTITAEYDLAKFFGFPDYEAGGAFIKCNSDINFNITSNTKLNFSGNIQIGCTFDTDFGNHIRVHSHINYEQQNTTETIQFMEDGYSFKYEKKSKSGDEYELIYHVPSDILSNYLIYIHNEGKYDSRVGQFPNTRKSGIKKHQSSDNYIKVISYEHKDNDLPLYHATIDVLKKKNEKEFIEQIGNLMHKVCPEYTNKLRELKNTFTEGNVSLIDNLIDATFQSYTNEEVQALFGFARKPMVYQNGASNLLEGYLGNVEDFPFISEKGVNKTLKPNN